MTFLSGSSEFQYCRKKLWREGKSVDGWGDSSNECYQLAPVNTIKLIHSVKQGS